MDFRGPKIAQLDYLNVQGMVPHSPNWMQILVGSVHRIEVEDVKSCLPVCCDANTLLSLIEISELETNSLRTIPL